MNSTGAWPIELYRRSVPKQEKYKQLAEFLGPTNGLRCLDLGVDSGAISYMLRKNGGSWKSADTDAEAVARAQEMLGASVFRIEPSWTPFLDEEFDRIVVVDLLEHLPEDRAITPELHRVLRSSGSLILNVPHDQDGLIRRIGAMLGQTYRTHGHKRPGYTVADLDSVLGEDFEIERSKTYSKFFSEITDLLVRFALDKSRRTRKMVHHDRKPSRLILLAYKLTYSVFWLISKLDYLLFFQSGHKLLVEARPRGATR